MSTFSSANITDGNLVLKERTHRIKIKYSMHQYSIRLHNIGNWLILAVLPSLPDPLPHNLAGTPDVSLFQCIYEVHCEFFCTGIFVLNISPKDNICRKNSFQNCTQLRGETPPTPTHTHAQSKRRSMLKLSARKLSGFRERSRMTIPL